MTANARILTQLAAILTTLAETGGSPASLIYIALGMDLEQWHQIERILTAADYITIRNHFVTLTPKGRDKAREIEIALLARH